METPSNDIEKKLEKIKPVKLSDSEKGVLWSKIMRDIETKSYEKKLSIFSIFSRKFAFASILIVALVGGSTVTVATANDAKPGDFLFPIDIISEKMQLVFTKRNKKSTLRLRFAEERLNEARITLAAVTGTSNFYNNSITETNLETAQSAPLAGHVFDAGDIDKANEALTVALGYLENTRIILVDEGNEIALFIIDDIISDLTTLAVDYMNNLDELKITIKDDEEKVSIKIIASSDGLKSKFKFEQEEGEEEGKIKIELKTEKKDGENELKTEFKFEQKEDGEIKFKFELKNKKGKKDGKKGKITLCHVPPGNTDNEQTIKVGSSVARAHLSHGDVLGACADDSADDDAPDETDPVLSSIGSDVTGDTTATITWTTDENADSKVEYATSTPIDDAFDPQTVSNTNDVTSHSINLTELLAETEYFYEVSSKDPSGNKTTSSVHSFTTAPEGDTTAPTVSNVASSTTQTTATITWDTDEISDSTVHYDTTSGVSTSDSSVHSANYETSHSLIIAGLIAETTYYFIVLSEDPSGNATTSNEFTFTTKPPTPDTTNPVISNVNETVDSHTSATITWTTDEDADSIVYYSSTTDPVNTSDSETDFVSNTSMTQSHSIELSGLLEGTTYFYTIVSSDTSGNTATSSDHHFITTAPDTTAPVISSVASANITASTTVVTWTTDENADSTVYYDTTSGFTISESIPKVEDGILTVSHSLDITGLTASTTYHFIVESVDSLSNTATSSEQSFTTL
ncbi:fibronectin type III domain-containing protein [Patescibacteria group bacterium]|nr:fibronectin type III domain-containing protein [Patescibacteria group bacterium]